MKDFRWKFVWLMAKFLRVPIDIRLEYWNGPPLESEICRSLVTK